MNNRLHQENLLCIAESGVITSQLHASVLFPDFFGPLTASDRKKHFNDKKFKKWTKCRALLRPAKCMEKLGGCVDILPFDNDRPEPSIGNQESDARLKRPKSREEFMKVVQAQRKKFEKLKDTLHAQERLAIRCGNDDYLKEVMGRLDEVHDMRHLLFPFADCFVDVTGRLNHGSKSKFLKYAVRDNRDIIYPLNVMKRSTTTGKQTYSSNEEVSRSLFSCHMPPYLSVQFDVMNALHYRGDTGHRGTSLRDIVIGKMKSVLRPWITGRRAFWVTQIHLHIDDPTLVLPQKTAEQKRRDQKRANTKSNMDGLESSAVICTLDFDEELNVPWSSLLKDRAYKDELASLHLFCGAAAAFELLKESKHVSKCSVFLHGGCFAIPNTFSIPHPEQCEPKRYLLKENSVSELLRGRVLLTRSAEKNVEATKFIPIPRSRCLKKTSSVWCFRLMMSSTLTVSIYNMSAHRVDPANGWMSGLSQTVIISDDTDVFLILLCNPIMYERGVLNVLNDTIHSVDHAVKALASVRSCGPSFAALYCIAGCDFSRSIYGMGHEAYWESFVTFLEHNGTLVPPLNDKLEQVDTLMCLLFLRRAGKTLFCNGDGRKRDIHQTLGQSGVAWNQEGKKRRSFFVSQYCVGSGKWRVEARNFVADSVTYANQLIPNEAHVKLHAARATFISTIYWGRSKERNLSPAVVAGCTESNGYDVEANVLIESVANVKTLMSSMKGLLMSCNCKGHCASRRCQCVRKPQKCIGCGCDNYTCQNRVIVRIDHGGSVLLPQKGGQKETSETIRGDVHPGRRSSGVLTCGSENDASDDSHCESGGESEVNMHAGADSLCESESSSAGSGEHVFEDVETI